MTSVNDSLMYQGNCNVPTWDRDSGGNITGLVGPDGTLLAIGQVLDQQHTDSSKSDANTDEAILYSYTIPGGLVGPNDSLILKLSWEFTNHTVNKNRRVRLGGIAGTQMQYDASGSGALGFEDEVKITNRGATNSQISSRVLGNSTVFGSQSAGSFARASKDMTVDQDLVVTGAWATAGDGSKLITLCSVTLIHLPGAG